MRKLLFAGLAVTALAIAPSALADDTGEVIKDADQCAATGTTAEANVSNQDDGRGYACVAAEGTVLFYIGGEAQSEQNPGQGGACGAIVLGGQTVTGDTGWNDDSNPDDTNPEHCQ